jgi:hypothetical protein
LSKIYFSIGIILLLILELIIGYFFQRQYADIMGTENIISLYVCLLGLNIIGLYYANRKTDIIKLVSSLLLIFIPFYFYITKPDYTVDKASLILANRFNVPVTHMQNLNYEDNKVFVFFSEQNNTDLYYFNPFNGESGVLGERY